MKQRLEATHFIEVWRGFDNVIVNSKVKDYKYWEDKYVKDDFFINLPIKIIAVWKIRYK